MDQTRITVCICTYNRYDRLPAAIDSALGQSLDRALYRVVVVDNSPDHDEAERFGSPYRDGSFLQYLIERTPGLSNARNVGARVCGTEFIAFMDDDAIASPRWLEETMAAFDHFGDRVAAVGGRVEPIWEAPRPSWVGDSMLGLVSVVNWGGEMRIAGAGEWLAGTNISFRAQTILDAGGFDLNLGRKGGGASLLSNEEIAIVSHLRERGLLSAYAPEASVRHLVETRRLQRSWFRKRMAWQAVSDYMADPVAAVKMAREGWAWAMDYFFALPPQERTIRGLYHETESPELMRRQLDAIYTFTLMQLAGFEGIPEQDRLALGRL